MSVNFNVYCINTIVEGLTGRALGYVKQSMTAKPKGYQFMPSYKKGYWDGNICLLEDNSFPTGLLFLAANELTESQVDFEVTDNQPNVTVDIDLDMHGYELRDYQIEAIEAALESRRGILKMATNSGKTLVTASIIKSTGCNALVVVPSKALLHQTKDYYKKTLNVDVGMVGDGYKELDASIVVTTMASFYIAAAESCRRPFNTLILDEVHHAKAKSISDAAGFVEAPIRIGVSGTPLSYDILSDLTLMGITGPLLYEIGNMALIKFGYSVKPIIIFHEINQPDISKTATYKRAYQKLVVDNHHRNNIIADIARESQGLTLILVERLDHVSNLLALIPEAVPATGNTDVVAILEGMRQSRYKAVVATNVFSEGIDADGIDNIVLAGAGQSHIRLLQRIGRGLRFREGKGEVLIHDFIDSNSDYLLKQSEQRLNTYEREGFDVILSES